MKFTLFTIFKHPGKCFPEHSNVVHYLISEFFLHIIPLNPINNAVKQMFRLHLTDEEMETQRPEVIRVTKGVKGWNWDVHTRLPHFKT